ncbi:MAG: ribosomal protein S18-alanine N-acetyltransferase [Anaerolineales bacterium]|jgi:ribosomal-protein-alanine N-acetyltransferase|nr:ribosomal protein S18-alanine N-acetyltransferase [Anaerolineales bacterium]WKZ41127.1 MAG: ribosomal protein S18-alanine N-acetyltransferase [Anaerolineales bacterium]
MSLVIRKMAMEDLEQVIAIDQVSFSLPWPSRTFQYELTDNPASRCWVAELDGRVAAMLVGWLIVDELHIATIATHPDLRGQGIGKAILLHALRSARDEGVLKSFLEVRASNVTAQKMYKSFGYVEDGRRKEYYKDNAEDAILMSLNDLNHLPGE